MFEQEVAFIVYKDRILDYSIGTMSNVEFNFDKIEQLLKYKKKLQEMYNMPSGFNPIQDFNPDDLTFIHVHPPNCNFYSELDRQVMKGYSLYFKGNVPFRFYIVTFTNQKDNKDLHHTVNGWHYDKIEKRIMNDDLMEQINKDHLYFLKYLAYNDFKNESKDYTITKKGCIE